MLTCLQSLLVGYAYALHFITHLTSSRRAFTEIQKTFTETFMEVGLIFTATSHEPSIMEFIIYRKEGSTGLVRHRISNSHRVEE